MIRADARVAEPRWSRDYLAPSYRVGETQHAYALQVLARLFGGSETSRLWRALVVDSKLALSASAGYSPASLGLTSFGFGVHPARGAPVAEIEAAVADQMKKLLDGGVTAEEVERAQNQLLAAAIYAQDSLASGPRLYGAALAHRRHDGRHRRLAAAHRRRHAGRGVVAARVMSGATTGGSRRCSRRRTAADDARAIALAGAGARRRAGRLPAAPAAVDIKEVTTPLGIKAWLVEDKSAPVVALSFSFAGGTASEPAGQTGVTSLMAILLTDGAGPLRGRRSASARRTPPPRSASAPRSTG